MPEIKYDWTTDYVFGENITMPANRANLTYTTTTAPAWRWNVNANANMTTDGVEALVDTKIKNAFENLYKKLSEIVLLPISEEEFINVLLEGDKE